jgi:hypothetical protein
MRHTIGSHQAYQSLLGSAFTLRLLTLMVRSPITAQSETKAHSSTMALMWCYGGLMEAGSTVKPLIRKLRGTRPIEARTVIVTAPGGRGKAMGLAWAI